MTAKEFWNTQIPTDVNKCYVHDFYAKKFSHEDLFRFAEAYAKSVSQQSNQKNRRAMTDNERKQAGEIKPCPFCGNEARVTKTTFGDSLYEYCRVECNRGHCLDQWNDTDGEAIDYWNERSAFADLKVSEATKEMYPRSFIEWKDMYVQFYAYGNTYDVRSIDKHFVGLELLFEYWEQNIQEK